MSNRRNFIKSFSAAAIRPHFINYFEFIDSKKSLKASLSPGAIGIRCTAKELLDYAIKFKFSAISPPLRELIQFKESDKMAYLEKMKEKTAFASILVGLIGGFLLFPAPDFSKSLLIGVILPIEFFPIFVTQSLLFLSFVVATILPVLIWKLR